MGCLSNQFCKVQVSFSTSLLCHQIFPKTCQNNQIFLELLLLWLFQVLNPWICPLFWKNQSHKWKQTSSTYYQGQLDYDKFDMSKFYFSYDFVKYFVKVYECFNHIVYDVENVDVGLILLIRLIRFNTIFLCWLDDLIDFFKNFRKRLSIKTVVINKFNYQVVINLFNIANLVVIKRLFQWVPSCNERLFQMSLWAASDILWGVTTLYLLWIHSLIWLGQFKQKFL